MKLAEEGNGDVQFLLGKHYERGIETTKDEEKAFQWYLKSAKRGNHLRQTEGGSGYGQHNLRYCYENGMRTKDEEKAFQWYLKSAERGCLIGQFNLGTFQWYLKSAEEGDSDAQFNLGCCYENGIGTIKDEGKAFQWYLKSAERGNFMGRYNLGCCYRNGIGTTKDEKKASHWYMKSAEDEEKAFQWYLKSAEGKDSIVQYQLGNCYRNGIGTIKDEEKAFQSYLKSAEGGNSLGQYNLGDEEKAFQWYLKSVEGENHLGQFRIGDCYINGIGTTKDERKAFQWYLKSAEGGAINAQYNLGIFYSNRIGTIKDEEKAFQWYLKSVEGGNHTGRYNVGYCYQHGIGTIENKEKAFRWIGIMKDDEKAFQWYLKLAEEGNHEGQSKLGYCYHNGIGTIKDEEKAFQWYLKSVEGGDSNVQANLGYCYSNGIGTTKDEEKWDLKSAEGGDHAGQNNLGYCYLHGFGTTKDEEKAFRWSLKSAEGGDKFGQSSIEYFYRNEISYVKKKRNKLEYRCHNCENLNILNNTCPDCKLIEIPKWTSGNNDVDKIIQMTQSDENANEWEIWRWIEYSKLKNIEYLAEGGFGTIWKAEWIDMPEELIANFQCRNKYVLPIFGITQDSMTKEFAIVLRYMKNGNLRDFLNQNKSLPWIERLWLLNSFIRGLSVIHDKGFSHRDLHPGNLMITEACSNSKYKFIRFRIMQISKSSGACGVLPYIAPEILNKNKYTQASDIYSVGIIMWIILTGKKPFSNRAYDSELSGDIFNGLRPKINKGTPQCYIELMKKCWHKDPAECPSAEMIYDISEKWIKDLLYDLGTYSLMFLNADQKMSNENVEEDLSSAETSHPKANVTSKLLPSDFNNFNVNNHNFDGR
ncbi:hypothetical protein Glove_255g13 [Diversispora epigaea]|uniref:Protein kinase domain-containing protein n=1 Tax=Diversispora epigaea TaxID=1348612 RepID=A0A397IF94_9GLOM|nr:hypothetical protein Glove_255g13 [Diversispora epigaea]